MLVEAARLGATPSGTDVDPMAVEIIRHELQPPNEAEVSALARELLRYLSEETAGLFCSTAKGWEPLHYFYLHVVCCPVCRSSQYVVGCFLHLCGGVNQKLTIIAKLLEPAGHVCGLIVDDYG
jgi:hypothetical protein